MKFRKREVQAGMYACKENDAAARLARMTVAVADKPIEHWMLRLCLSPHSFRRHSACAMGQACSPLHFKRIYQTLKLQVANYKLQVTSYKLQVVLQDASCPFEKRKRIRVCQYVCLCVRLCVCERERERVSVCMYVCTCKCTFMYRKG